MCGRFLWEFIVVMFGCVLTRRVVGGDAMRCCGCVGVYRLRYFGPFRCVQFYFVCVLLCTRWVCAPVSGYGVMGYTWAFAVSGV